MENNLVVETVVLRLSVSILRRCVNLVVLYIIKTQYKRVETREVCGFLHPSSLTIFCFKGTTFGGTAGMFGLRTIPNL